VYMDLFGDPWVRAQKVEPLFPPGLVQPPLSLPFTPGETWDLTGGPHYAYGTKGALAALDFAPGADQKGCYQSESWVLAAASGRVVRSGNGIVVLDLDNDGYEQTGWDLFYLHIATQDRVPVGTWLNADDRVGHPSCEGGPSTGTHIHFARKFNGEWILADGPIPFNLSGWIAHAGDLPREGTMTKGDQVVVAQPNGAIISKLVRLSGE
jgi:LasA protease